MQARVVTTLLFIGIAQAGPEKPPLEEGSVGRGLRIKSIAQFFEAMREKEPPTIATFKRLFGPHNEEELILQLRHLGDRSPIDKPADPAMVRRVNERLAHPTRHQSLFLCFLRREMPELRSRDWRVTSVVRREDAGEEIYTVGVDGRKLRFAFPIRDDYIGGLVDDKGSIVSADRFLPLCRVDDCCQ